ncbi:hypothetical protein RclHR1_02060012 [Rhizophagus clarus]|uniref:Uncharacterized protein n=1 Tax=Rhizophagus clarus TaxID=94130 RepID=A0A2Z6R465_9GLOM|nr:hypothetical protein RclHR1_02060012 [Rhizophagus clarus]GES97950.1 hypothetical protein RCL_jg3705.t1 [Rhizophagus clarus]
MNVNKSNTTTDQRKRKNNNFRIFMNATMQLLSSPPTSPTTINSSDFCSSPSSVNSNESSYFSFPEFEIYDEITNNSAQREVDDDMVVQMERFDEMYVNGVRLPFRQI